MKPTPIPIARPLFGKEEVDAATGPLTSGWIVQGPRVAEFEHRFGQFVGASHALACSNGTTALHLCASALRLGSGDEVIVPAFTWIATPNSVVYTGARPVFCDIDLETFNISAAQISKTLTSNTRAVLPVHLFGLCADMGAVLEIASDRSLAVIEDAACALGATVDGKAAGTFGDIAAFSLHPRKSITTGEGGVVTTASDDLARIVRSQRDHGVAERAGEPAYLLPDYDEIGFNYRLTDLQAAVGNAQMDRLAGILSERKRRARLYDEALANLGWLRTPVVPPGMEHTYQAYVCLFAPETPTLANSERLGTRRNSLMARLEERGISTRQGTHAPVTQSAYRKRFNIDPQQFPNAVMAERLSLALPLYPQMTDEEQGRVIDALREAEP